MKSYINFGNDWVAGAPRGLQHRCLDDKSRAGFNSQAFPQHFNIFSKGNK
tara:strand:- start:151 stop:300 length:150 start_codon:yes stop_codon:yes gene_type:complete